MNKNKNIYNLASRRFLSRIPDTCREIEEAKSSQSSQTHTIQSSQPTKLNNNIKYTYLNYYIITLLYFLFSIKIE
jgi:hypothetical protein